MKSDDGVKEWTAMIVSYIENHRRGEADYPPSVNGASAMLMDAPSQRKRPKNFWSG